MPFFRFWLRRPALRNSRRRLSVIFPEDGLDLSGILTILSTSTTINIKIQVPIVANVSRLNYFQHLAADIIIFFIVDCKDTKNLSDSKPTKMVYT